MEDVTTINQKNLLRFCACGITAITMIGGTSSVVFASEYDNTAITSQAENDLKEKKAATEEKLEQLNCAVYEYDDIIKYHESMLQASEMAWNEYQQAQLNLDQLM